MQWGIADILVTWPISARVANVTRQAKPVHHCFCRTCQVIELNTHPVVPLCWVAILADDFWVFGIRCNYFKTRKEEAKEEKEEEKKEEKKEEKEEEKKEEKKEEAPEAKWKTSLQRLGWLIAEVAFFLSIIDVLSSIRLAIPSHDAFGVHRFRLTAGGHGATEAWWIWLLDLGFIRIFHDIYTYIFYGYLWIYGYFMDLWIFYDILWIYGYILWIYYTLVHLYISGGDVCSFSWVRECETVESNMGKTQPRWARRLDHWAWRWW